MKLVTYLRKDREQLGLLIGDQVYDSNALHHRFPATMKQLLLQWDLFYPGLLAAEKVILKGGRSELVSQDLSKLRLLAPLPRPGSCRDGYAFRQHVETARRNRGVAMIPEFDRYPVFYFTNHRSIQGPGAIYVMPDHLDQLDYELEAAIVICRRGQNIPAAEADRYIGGLMVMNDLSARTLQSEEMLLNLGPAKGKDFSTATGPWLVTPDELRSREVPPQPGHTGKAWNLRMTATVNGLPLSEGNLAAMNWTFAELIERASYGTELYPGDIIGSGTVGTGCLLELNGTGRLSDPGHIDQWLVAGDSIELRIEGLGSLHNYIDASPTDWSIRAKHKGV